jgi:hypothetical protein
MPAAAERFDKPDPISPARCWKLLSSMKDDSSGRETHASVGDDL